MYMHARCTAILVMVTMEWYFPSQRSHTTWALQVASFNFAIYTHCWAGWCVGCSSIESCYSLLSCSRSLFSLCSLCRPEFLLIRTPNVLLFETSASLLIIIQKGYTSGVDVESKCLTSLFMYVVLVECGCPFGTEACASLRPCGVATEVWATAAWACILRVKIFY